MVPAKAPKFRYIPRGIASHEHERLALRLKSVVADVRAIRDAVRAGLGDEGEAYEAADEALGGLRRLRLALSEALPDTDWELRELYLKEMP